MGRKSEGHFSGGAYISVVFSMIFLAVISVVLSALEAVRVSAVRLQAEVACAIACEAFLSQYQPQVQARYGLYLIERDGYDVAFLQQFINENCRYSKDRGDLCVRWQMPELESVTIDGELDLWAEDFRYFEEQISDLMIVKKGSDYAGEILDRLSGNSSVDVEDEKDQFTSRLNQVGISSDSQKEAAQNAAQESEQNGQAGDPSGEEQNTSKIDDPRDSLTQMLKYPILSLIMDGEVSKAVLESEGLSDLTSPEKNVSSIRSFMDYKDITNELEDNSLDVAGIIQDTGNEFLVDCYIIDFFKNAAGQDRTDDSTVLSYEVEYILSGREADAANLQNTVNRLSLIRMIMNMVYLMQSGTKTAAVRAVAAALASAVLMPFLEELFYLLIIAAWAYGEALVDCKCLLGGGKIPLMKSDSTWTLSLEQLTKIGISQLSGYAAADNNSEGLGYEDYLRLLLLSISKEKKYIRLMNIIEANIRLEEGCGSFLLSNCVFGISVCADFIFYPVFFHNTLGKPRYEHHVRKSIAY